jgi:hypothetical protein
MDAYFEIIIPEFGEVLDENWEAEEERVRQHYLKRLSTYPRGHIDAKVETRNIGRGADWIVVVISLASAVATGFVAIPKAHKLIRESVEEWQRIFNELKALFGWLAPRRALYPDNFLFLTAFVIFGRNKGGE